MTKFSQVNGEVGIIEKYEIAELKTAIRVFYSRLASQGKQYLCDFKGEADITIDLPFSRYKRIQEKYFTQPLPMVEYIYSGMLFYRYLLFHNGLMMHASAVVVDGYAYLFSADSGGGKSTHTNLWIDYFKDKAYILNDDKPAIRFIDNEWYAYGTPWSGKTDCSKNAKVKLGGIVFVEKSPTNKIELLNHRQAIGKVMAQTQKRFKQQEMMEKVLEIVNRLTTQVPIYRMECNISMDAVEMAYNTIKRCE